MFSEKQRPKVFHYKITARLVTGFYSQSPNTLLRALKHSEEFYERKPQETEYIFSSSTLVSLPQRYY